MTEDDKALVERLREEAADWDEPKRSDEVDVRGMLHNAADRIEQLTAEVERLREALGGVMDDLANGIIIAEEEGADASWLKGARKRLATARAALEETSHD